MSKKHLYGVIASVGLGLFVWSGVLGLRLASAADVVPEIVPADRSHGADGVTDGSAVSLLDYLEYDYTIYTPSSQHYAADLEQKLNLFEQKVGVKPCAVGDLAWFETGHDLEDIRDEGAVRHYLDIVGQLAEKFKNWINQKKEAQKREEKLKKTSSSERPKRDKKVLPETWKFQLAIQKNQMVVFSRLGLEAIAQQTDPFGRPHDEGAVLHELLICTAIRERLNIKTPEFGTDPIRLLNAMLIVKNSETVVDRAFKEVWGRLPKIPEPHKEEGGVTFNVITPNTDGAYGDDTVTVTKPKVRIGDQYYFVALANSAAPQEELNSLCKYFKLGPAIGKSLTFVEYDDYRPHKEEYAFLNVTNEKGQTETGGLVKELRFLGSEHIRSPHRVDVIKEPFVQVLICGQAGSWKQ